MFNVFVKFLCDRLVMLFIGGEGCLQSVGGSSFGVGADIGGSIRMPAFFNGVFGHKVTSSVFN